MRRQTPASGATVWPSLPTRLDPFALPVRYSAAMAGTAPEAPAAILLDRDRAVIRRPLSRGVSMTLTLPVSVFSGVAVRMVPVGHEGEISVTVELLHPDPALSVPLAIADSPEAIVADWQAWSVALGLPLLIVEADGRVRQPETRIGRLTVGDSTPRRRGAYLARRPRFLARRKPGGPLTDAARLTGREIIAPE